MVDIAVVFSQRPDLFNKLAEHWYETTGGELMLLSLDGTPIKCRVESISLDSIKSDGSGLATIVHRVNDSIEVLPDARAIIAPMNTQGEVRGYLLSYNSGIEQQAMLTWVAEVLLDYLNSEQALQGMTDELIVAWDQLELVYRIAKTLGGHTNLSNVLTSTLEEVTQVITVELAFIVFIYKGRFNCVMAGAKQLPLSFSNQTLLERLSQLDQLVLFNSRVMALDVWPDAPESLANFIGTPIPTTSNTRAVLGLINNHKQGSKFDFTAGQVKLITAVSEQVGAIFDYFGLQDEIIAQERVRHELEIAAEIQESLLPGDTPHVKRLAIDVTTLPAYEVGGDFYDFVCNSETQVTAIIGDVAGKGIPAAMVTSMIRTMLRVEALHGQEPHEIINRANEVLKEDLGRADLFVTAFVGAFDTKAGVLMYANAGHVPAIIYHTRAKQSRLLKATSLPIGIAEYQYSRPTQYVHVSPGDTLVIYSDGIFEATDPQGNQFGLESIQNLVHQYADRSTPAQLKEVILNNLAEFSQTQPRADDVTLLVLKFTPEVGTPERKQATKVIEQMPFRYTADTAHLGDISQKVTTACRTLIALSVDPTREDFVYLVELAVSEIFTNIIEHAYDGREGFITGRLTLTTTGIEIDVYDQGEGFNPNAILPPISDPTDPTEGGYGLHIVRQVMDVAQYDVGTPDGNHWKLIKYLPE